MAFPRFNPDSKRLEVFEADDGGIERCIFDCRVTDVHLEFGVQLVDEPEVLDHGLSELDFEDEA